MTVGARLKEERLRLGHSQTEFALLASVKKGTQISWEKDASSPSAAALVAFAQAGADVLYILTGKRERERPDRQQQDVEQRLAEVREDVLDPGRKQLASETRSEAENRVLLACRDTLLDILRWADDDGLPINLVEETQSLLDVLKEPKGVELYRAADYAQGRKRRSEEWELLQIWLEGWPYQPDDTVMKLLVKMVIEYGVHHKVLVELSQEIATDVEEQRLADLIIADADRDVSKAP